MDLARGPALGAGGRPAQVVRVKERALDLPFSPQLAGPEANSDRDRDQPFLLPPDLRDWLPQDHLAWCLIDVIDQLDLTSFYRTHRDDGHGRPAYHPKLLLGVLLYAYCLGCAPPARSNAA
jgi:hypothetical protein